MNRILFVSKSRLENTLNEYDAVYSSVLTWKGRMDQQNSNIAQANEGASTDKYTEKTTEYMNGELSDFLGHVNITKCALAEAFTKTKGLIARSEDFVNILRGSDALNSESYEACGSSGDLATYYDDFCTYGAYTGAINDNTNSIIELGGKEEESLGNIEQELLGLKTVSVSIDGMASGIRECIKKQNYTEPLYNSLKGYCIDVGIMHRYVTSLRNTYFLASTGARAHNRSYNYDGAPTEDKEEIYTMNLKEMGYSEEDIKVLKRYTGLTASQLYDQISHMPASEVSNMIRLAYANCGTADGSDEYETMYNNLPEDQRLFVDNIDKLNYSEEKLAGMRCAAICLFSAGYEKEFVAGALANIACEGDPGRFENSAYTSEWRAEPKYLVALDAHHNYRETMSNRSISEVGIAETIAYLKEINQHDNEYDTTYYTYSKEKQDWVQKQGKPDLHFGIGMVQWTDDDRAECLMNLYAQMADSNNPTSTECARIEGTYMAYELTGHDGAVDHTSVYNNWKNGNASVYQAGYQIASNYEIPAGGDTEYKRRADLAVELYDTLVH